MHQPPPTATMSRPSPHIFYSGRSSSSNASYRPLQLHSSHSQASLCSSTYRSGKPLSSTSGRIMHHSSSPAQILHTVDQPTKPARYSLNSLGHIWYGLLAILLQVCIVSRNVQRFTAYLELPWPLHHEPLFQLNAYVVLTALAVVILPFFFVCAVVRVGNLANDGVKLPTDSILTSGSSGNSSSDAEQSNHRNRSNSGFSFKNAICAGWTHAPPLMGLLHLASALCFLSAQSLMQTELIKHNFLPQERIWSNELEPLLCRIEQSPLSSLLASGLQSVLPAHQPAAQPQHPPARALVMPETEVRRKLQLDAHSLELINLVAALLQLCLRYPAVLWPAHRLLSLLLSAEALLTSAVALLAYGGHSAYVRWRLVLGSYGGSLDTLTSGQSAIAFTVYCVCLLFGCVALHAYALRKRTECVQRRALLRQRHLAERPVYVSYAPHYFAALLLLLACAAALPLLHAFCTLYMATGHLRPLVAAAAIAMHAAQLLLLWISLSCKRRWRFASESGSSCFRQSSSHSRSDSRNRDSVRNTPSHAPSSLVSDEFKHQLNNQLSSQLNQQFASQSLAQSLVQQLQQQQQSKQMLNQSSQLLSASLCGQSLTNYALLGPQLKSCLKGSVRYHCATTGRRGMSSHNDQYGRDAYSDSEGLTADPKQQRKRSRLPKFSFRDRARSVVGHNTLPSNLTKRKQKNCNVDSAQADYTDYAGFCHTSAVRNDDQLSTHMNLCPLQTDTGYLSDYDILRNAHQQQQQQHPQQFSTQQPLVMTAIPKLDSVSQLTRNNSTMQQRPPPLPPTPANRLMTSNAIYQGLQSIKEHFNSVSDSDTSSGVHSASTTTTTNGSVASGSKRSDSMEQLINCVQAPKPFLNSLSMQRQHQGNNVIYQTRLPLMDGIFEPPAQFVPISAAADPVYGCRQAQMPVAPTMSTFTLGRAQHTIEQPPLPPPNNSSLLPPPPPQLLQSPQNSFYN